MTTKITAKGGQAKMLFCEKLDFLFRLTGVKNNALARFVHLDPSFVSRLRSGTRTPSKKENYIKSIALFFAKHLIDEHQRFALSNILNIPIESIPYEEEILSNLIYQWFVHSLVYNIEPVRSFMNIMAKPVFDKQPSILPDNRYSEGYIKAKKSDVSVYYGIEGKRRAALEFLHLVANSKGEPQTLSLFSDEDVEWLISDLAFIEKWSTLLNKVAKRGNKIKIIHTVSRDLDDMLSAINQWLPVYMTGSIEPYYYPKIRDGMFRKTLFIAPGTAAVVAGSVGSNIEKTASFLFNENKVILALQEEFNDYFSFCRPLMKIFTKSKRREVIEILQEFEGEDSDTLIASDSLSTITMPMNLYGSFFTRAKININEELTSFFHSRIEAFEKNLQKHKFIEVVTTPDIENIQPCNTKIPFFPAFSEHQLFYTEEEYLLHLENVIRLLNEHKNFHVILKANRDISDFMLYVKEDVGVIISKTSIPSIMFAINESNLIGAFWGYMEEIVGSYSRIQSSKKDTIITLQKIVQDLKNKK